MNSIIAYDKEAQHWAESTPGNMPIMQRIITCLEWALNRGLLKHLPYMHQIHEDVHAAHSIYFTILADHGWIGLFLYLLIYFMT